MQHRRCMKLLEVFFLFLFVACFFSCNKAQDKTITIIVKTPIFNLKNIVDGNTKDAYTFLQKAAFDFQKEYEKASVKVEVVQYSSGRRLQEVEETYGTANAPDIVFCGNNDYVYLGNVVPLDDIVTSEMKGDIEEKYFSLKSIQGKLYTLPFCIMQNVLCYNKDLFFKAGLDEYISTDDVIQSWTLEEWEDVLCTLREKLPPDDYPMMMYAATEDGDTHIMLLTCAWGSDLLDSEGLFDLESPKGMQALEWMKSGVEKGCFPPAPQLLKMIDCYDLFSNGQLAIYCANAALQSLYDEKTLSLGYVNFPSLDGKGLCTTTVQGFQVFDNNDERKLKVAKDFLSFIYQSDYLDFSAGAIPVSKRVQEKYKDALTPVLRYTKNTARNMSFHSDLPNWQKVRKSFFPKMQELLDTNCTKTIEEIAKEIDADCNAAILEGKKNAKLHE